MKELEKKSDFSQYYDRLNNKLKTQEDKIKDLEDNL